MWKTISSNPMPRSVLSFSVLSFAFFAASQWKYFTANRVARCVPTRHTLASLECARECAQTQSDDHLWGPNATKGPN